MKYFFLLIACFLHITATAQVITLTDDFEIQKIGQQVYIFEDKEGKFNIQDVLHPDTDKLFTISTQEIPNYANTSSAIWIKIKCKNNAKHERFLLEIGNPLLDSIYFYEPDLLGQYTKLLKVGAKMPFTDRQYKTNLYLFNINFDTLHQEKTFYFRFKSEYPIELPIKIGTLKQYFEQNHKNDIGYGIYFGIMLIMIFYNFFLYLSSWDRTYLYYIIYILSLIVLHGNFKGYSFEFLWSQQPIINYYTPTIAAITTIFLLVFARSFLHTAENFRKINAGLNVFILILFIAIFLNIIKIYPISALIAQLSGLLSAVYLLSIGIYCYLKGLKQARFYIIAWSIFLVCFITFILQVNAVLPSNAFTANAVLYGSAIEVALLALALADRINILKKEKEATQVQLLSSLQENDRIIREQNRILEERVTERTFQLQEANEELNQTVEELNATNETLNRINMQVAEQNKEIEGKNVELNEVLQELNATNEELSSTNDALVNANEEIESQREAVARAYENIKILTIIGQKITQTLDLKEIIKMVYENVNELMDASGFGLGVYNAKLQELAFDGFMEKGKALPFHFHSTREENYLAVWCFRRKKSIFINDVASELKNYLDKDIDSMKISTGEIPQSLLYIPLIHEDEAIGVITVQSFEKNAYTQTHFDLLQNLASYCSIAVANANTYQELDAKNANITKSIEYARTIQHAVLPKQTDIAASFADHFILYKPKDIVSGDFYWYRRTEQFTFFAVADCTGHGVPGAFMSMIGNAILQDAIDRQQIYSPAAILEFIHVEVRNYLKKDDNTTSDGMDIAICMFEGLGTPTIKTTFAAAKRSMYIAYVQQQTVEEIKGDRTMIGTPEVAGRKPFTNKDLLLNQGDKLYLFSDGYGDQPNAKRSRFGTTAFKQIIDDNYQLTMAEQKQIFVDRLNAFQEVEEQRDDITVVGIEL
ncbi:MAG: 7TM diverse intracellular signaling domain-containing protein [Thermoflexibacteraceae bacterium]